jgi:hypothetical protein
LQVAAVVEASVAVAVQVVTAPAQELLVAAQPQKQYCRYLLPLTTP